MYSVVVGYQRSTDPCASTVRMYMEAA